MAAQAPREGLEFVPGTMEEVGVELLKHVDDPQDVIAYGGYGFWAPKSAISKVKGAEVQELTNAPIAPNTASYVDDSAYVDRETDEYGQPVAPDPAPTDADLEANAPFPDPVDDDTTPLDEGKQQAEDGPTPAPEPDAETDADVEPAKAKRATTKKSSD